MRVAILIRRRLDGGLHFGSGLERARACLPPAEQPRGPDETRAGRIRIGAAPRRRGRRSGRRERVDFRPRDGARGARCDGRRLEVSLEGVQAAEGADPRRGRREVAEEWRVRGRRWTRVAEARVGGVRVALGRRPGRRARGERGHVGDDVGREGLEVPSHDGVEVSRALAAEELRREDHFAAHLVQDGLRGTHGDTCGEGAWDGRGWGRGYRRGGRGWSRARGR